MPTEQRAATSNLVHGLTTQARCLAAQLADTDRIRFFVGSCSLRGKNEVHLIEVTDEAELDVRIINIFDHEHEISHLAPSPSDANLLFTCYNTVERSSVRSKATLWSFVEENSRLTEVGTIPTDAEKPRDISAVLWEPDEASSRQVVTLETGRVAVWDVNTSGGDDALVEKSSIAFRGGIEEQNATCGAWDPHFHEQVVAGIGSRVQGWDVRSGSASYAIPNAHALSVRDVDFNRNKPYYFVTGGDDGRVKFWDQRKCTTPVKQLGGHSHWVYNVKYNPFHDQLVASSGTDALVSLWNVSSISSAPHADIPDPEDIGWKDDVEDDEASKKNSRRGDHLIQTFEEHDDSVYAVAWSVADAYLFASLSFDGRVVINFVPQEEKDRILFAE
eukprot:TRINITY_DN3495_c0_g2_i1.p1 TRINITY_DN3495_c0_g2~~TRINITY_DN3495_c0_g2_i1.p1  ORF type:complete len:388 (-),score=91.05 TRINITY_DN3495_c0_g2_i1:236-1399(-)